MLSDEEFDIVSTLALPLRLNDRPRFFDDLAALLDQTPVRGPGLAHRLGRDLQRNFYIEPPRPGPSLLGPRAPRAPKPAAPRPLPQPGQLPPPRSIREVLERFERRLAASG